jgi:hypothetical protein
MMVFCSLFVKGEFFMISAICSPICRDPQQSLDLLPPPAAWVLWIKTTDGFAEFCRIQSVQSAESIGIRNSGLSMDWCHTSRMMSHTREWIPQTSRSLTQPRSRTSLLEPFVHWLGFLMLASEHENPGPRHFQAKNAFWIVRRIHI